MTSPGEFDGEYIERDDCALPREIVRIHDDPINEFEWLRDYEL